MENPREQVARTGRLKIFFGYAAGVGKTFAMLKAAHLAQRQGVDVVVGYIERHTRPDTLALLEGLEQLPTRQVEYRGIDLREFDLDAALERHPQLILVDELAHSNAAGSRHLKRYQDVQELLRAGIDVYTTVNVQHLESLHDLVASITQVSVSERIPDSVFDSADQVELVDIEPDDLIERLREGKIYQQKQAARALNHFFVRDNLAALREIALRRTADRLSRHAQKSGSEAAAKAGEHILVCLSSSPSNPKVLRTAARMAEAFHSGFTALFVETPETRELKGENLQRLRDNLRLAEQLGAQIATVYGEDPAVQIAEYARVSGVTKIVIGRTNHKASSPLKSRPLVDQLTRLAGDIDIYIIPDNQPVYHKKWTHKPRWPQPLQSRELLKVAAIVGTASLINLCFYSVGLREANIITVYLLGVLIAAVWTPGQLYGALASLLSVVAFNFLFTVPRFTLAATDPDYPVTFLIMLLASVLSSSLATQVKKQARQSAQKAYYMELLMTCSQKLQQGRDEWEIIRVAAEQIQSLLDRPILYALDPAGRELEFRVTPEDETEILATFTPEERAVANWVIKNNKRAGAGTDTLRQAQNLYLSVRGNLGVMGIVAIPVRSWPPLEVFEKNVLIAILNECGLILERRKLEKEKQAIELETRQERLRSSLLRAISHDLRTPLTSISGNAGVLMERSIQLDEAKKQQIYASIYDDSMWLINLTENLLSITRIENGTMHLQMEPELLEDVFQEALAHIDRRSAEHTIRVQLDDDLLMARMDARLIVQVIINIINNAIQYTQKGSCITLSACRKGEMAEVSIADDGPGIPPEVREHLFDLFYTAEQGRADSRRGLGLGLNLCRSIISAHGGCISVSENRPKGSVFTFTLPLEEARIDHV